MIHEFYLSPRESGRGVSCDANGAFIGTVPLLRRLQRNGRNAWQPRSCDDISDAIGEHYGLPIDISSKRGGLTAIANALNEGDIARAQIATVLLGIPDLPPLSKGARSRALMIKLIRDLEWSGLIKWESDEHPRWPAGSTDSKGGQFAPKGEAEADTSFASGSDARDQSRPRSALSGVVSRTSRIQLAGAGNVVSDASDDPALQAARAASAIPADRKSFVSEDIFAALDAARQDSEADDSPKVVLAAASEDERDPRFGIGGTMQHRLALAEKY